MFFVIFRFRVYDCDCVFVVLDVVFGREFVGGGFRLCFFSRF